jgi:hypothetical protein
MYDNRGACIGEYNARTMCATCGRLTPYSQLVNPINMSSVHGSYECPLNEMRPCRSAMSCALRLRATSPGEATRIPEDHRTSGLQDRSSMLIDTDHLEDQGSACCGWHLQTLRTRTCVSQIIPTDLSHSGIPKSASAPDSTCFSHRACTNGSQTPRPHLEIRQSAAMTSNPHLIPMLESR